jgi:hypothetical protein
MSRKGGLPAENTAIGESSVTPITSKALTNKTEHIATHDKEHFSRK